MKKILLTITLSLVLCGSFAPSVSAALMLCMPSYPSTTASQQQFADCQKRQQEIKDEQERVKKEQDNVRIPSRSNPAKSVRASVLDRKQKDKIKELEKLIKELRVLLDALQNSEKIIMLYILLSIIAIGVLLISPAGQRILRGLGITASIGAIIGVLIISIALVVTFWQQIWEFAKDIFGGFAVLAILLAVWVAAFIVVPNQINKLFKNPDHKKTFWILVLITIIALYIYRLNVLLP